MGPEDARKCSRSAVSASPRSAAAPALYSVAPVISTPTVTHCAACSSLEDSRNISSRHALRAPEMPIRLLCADDEEDIRTILRVALSLDHDLDVHFVASGAEALTHARRGGFDAIGSMA